MKSIYVDEMHKKAFEKVIESNIHCVILLEWNNNEREREQNNSSNNKKRFFKKGRVLRNSRPSAKIRCI